MAFLSWSDPFGSQESGARRTEPEIIRALYHKLLGHYPLHRETHTPVNDQPTGLPVLMTFKLTRVQEIQPQAGGKHYLLPSPVLHVYSPSLSPQPLRLHLHVVQLERCRVVKENFSQSNQNKSVGFVQIPDEKHHQVSYYYYCCVSVLSRLEDPARVWKAGRAKRAPDLDIRSFASSIKASLALLLSL